jgi:hypothetical protein
MKRKAGSGTATVTTEVRGALPAAKDLTPEEDRILRMRYGVGVSDLHAPLPRAADGNLADELLVLELQLHRAQRARISRMGGSGEARQSVLAGSQPVAQRTKDKIVRALRKKKQ